MGIYQSATIEITVPADRIAALAAELREYEIGHSGAEHPEIRDRDYVAFLLPLAEGSEDVDPDYVDEEEGDLVISTGCYGKVSFDSEEIERIYSANGATGTITGECEGEHYRTRLDGEGGLHTTPGVVIYPGDALHVIAGMFTDDLGFTDGLPKKFTCDEADALAEIVEMVRGPGSADGFLREHAAGDDDIDDRHHGQYLAMREEEG